MTLFQSIILGIVQGLTEFIPVSSSAHLVIVPYLFQWEIPADQAFVFDVLVQVATLAAVIIYFWRDLIEIARSMINGIRQKQPFASAEARMGWLLLLATIPAGLFGLLVKDAVEAAFNNPVITAVFLLVTAGLLLAAEYFKKGERPLAELTWKNALWIGIFQAVAVFPGVSRSGATITGGMTAGLARPAAARFAFLLSIPIMLAAGLLAALDMSNAAWQGASLAIFIPGFIAAALTGYFSIRWMLRFVANHSLVDFAIYCVGLGFLTIIVSLVRA